MTSAQWKSRKLHRNIEKQAELSELILSELWKAIKGLQQPSEH